MIEDVRGNVFSFLPRLVRRLALRAYHTHKPLGHDTRKRRGDKKGLHTHIEQTCNGGRRIIGMKRAQHEVPGERGLDRDLCSFKIAYLTKHYYVGVLP